MNGSWFFDDNISGIPDDFFHESMKYLDLPMEDLEPNNGEDWLAKFQHLDQPPYSVLTSWPSCFSSGISNDALEVKKCSPISSTAEASSSITSLLYDSLNGRHPQLFRTSSPISVLDSGSCSAENLISNRAKFDIPAKRLEVSVHKEVEVHLILSPLAILQNFCIPPSESEPDSCPDEKLLDPAQKRDQKKNLMLPSSSLAFKKHSLLDGVGTRKCTHCEVTSTSQWREGPMGPKTLCNACGVRYRSGRLLPEYRPAASPTFTASLHSNSHRKVLEMRKKSVQVNPAVTFATSSLAGEEPLL